MLLRYRLHDIRLGLRRARERALQGWSEPDSWAIDYYLDRIIPPMVRRLRDRRLGWPEGLVRDETEWIQILSAIADGFEAHEHLMELDWLIDDPAGDGFIEDTAQKEVWEKTFGEGVGLFVLWYDHLWD